MKLAQISAIPFIFDVPDSSIFVFRNKEEAKFFSASLTIKGKKFSYFPGDGILVLDNPSKLSDFFQLPQNSLHLEEQMKIKPEYILTFLVKNGYSRVSFDPYEEGDFSLVGDVFEIVIKKGKKIRIELFFDVVEKIYLIHQDEYKIERLKSFRIDSRTDVKSVKVSDYFENVFCFCKGELCDEHSKKTQSLKLLEEVLSLKILDAKDFLKGKENIEELLSKGYEIIFVVRDSYEEEFAKGLGTKTKRAVNLPYPFIIPERKFAVVSFELFSSKKKKETKPKLPPINLEELQEGTYVVHKVHGIGIFRGTTIEYGREFLKIEYKDSAMLYIRAEDISLLHKYIGIDNPSLDELGGRTFALRKKRVKQFIEKQLSHFMRAIALRRAIKRPPYFRADDILSHLSQTFLFEETPDQKKAIEEIVEDLCEKDYPADRIIIGDSGVGKTEIALRASAICAYSGKQVAFIAPTTPLALQHYMTFKQRLCDLPFEIAMLSRLTPEKEEKEIIQKIREGKIDIVIGTHKVLNILPYFKNLGLLIIDEEQRFGVSHKEKVNRIRATCDVISLTATPIPRTLKMALSGLKDISIIKTKPLNRGTIFTTLILEKNLKDVIEYELARGGQVIYVFPFISGLESIMLKLAKICHNAKISSIHGRMRPKDIEDIILAFMYGKVDILVATKIVALGLDIPNANTMVIERADLFGLSELYQLRGRVGRGDKDAFCYLVIPDNISQKSKTRIEFFIDSVNFSDDNIGFKLSLKDLEMRGAGNIFGKEQTGHIYSVGFDLYIEILQEVIESMKEKLELKKVDFEPYVEIDIPAFIPKWLVDDPIVRLSFYRAFAMAESEDDVEEIKKVIIERFSRDEKEIYEELENFVKISKLKVLMRKLKVYSAIFSKDLSYVDIESDKGKVRIPLLNGIDDLIQLMRKSLPDNV
jgi:transcription-repair coupling factor (superfamily II helicase)